jgi:integrase
LSAAEARQLRALLAYDAQAVKRDLPDFVAMMLATGLRIGECAALKWENIDLEAGTVTVRSTVVLIGVVSMRIPVVEERSARQCPPLRIAAGIPY